MHAPRFVHFAFAVAVAISLARTALAQDAGTMWPPPADVTPAQVSNPLYWPNDPGYTTQWEHWSWVPMGNQALPGFRSAEIAIGAGDNDDRAWGLTIGDPHVLIDIIDSGIEWDERDLQLQAALNIGELPLPMGATHYDANGDGLIDVSDYANDPRVTCGTTLPHPISACTGSDGMPNDSNANGILDAGDLIQTFSDGTDDDANGYTDDIAGWDFLHNDNDPYDDVRYGHGTGEAKWSVAAGNNGIGNIGVCPRCQFIMTRAADSFIGEVDAAAAAMTYGTDADYGAAPDGQHRRVHVIQIAIGTLDNSRFMMNAIDYAYGHQVLVDSSAADENSRHHNMPTTNNHTMVVHAVRYDTNTLATATSFLAFNNCTNYGGQLQLSVAGTGCSSEATGQSSGVAGLIYSWGLQHSLAPALTAEEVRQLFLETVDDIDIPESQPTNPNYDSTLYPSLPGWDQRFGYGRINSRRALEWLQAGQIPPEVDITSPRWFESLFTDRAPTLTLQGRIAAQRATSFDYIVQWAPGIEPDPSTWTTIQTGTNVTTPIAGTLATLDLTALHIDNPGEIENEFTITLRVQATAHYAGMTMGVPGESRRVFSVLQDPDLLAGFPVDVHGSGESSPHAADLVGDGQHEIVMASGDGLVHAVKSDGSELAGFPTHTNVMLGFRPGDTPSYVGAPAYRGASPAIDPTQSYEPVIATVGIADLDGNGTQEIVASSYVGTVYVWNHDGTPWGHGFPFTLPDVPSSATDPSHILARGIFGSPVLYDIDNDGRREIVFAAFDGNLYALDASTGTVKPGFPVLIHLDEPMAEYNRAFGSVGIGHFDGDTFPEIVAVSNEQPPGDPNYGAIYVVHGDGNAHPGGAYMTNWPIVIPSAHFLPLVGEGISSSPAMADIDHDGLDEIAVTGTGSLIGIVHGQQPAHASRTDPTMLAHLGIPNTSSRGMLSNDTGTIVSMLNAFSLGSFGDMTGDATPEFVMTGADINLAINLAGGGTRVPFNHLAGAWDAVTGSPLPGFPRVLEDYTFFENPSIADVSGDAYAEALIGTGGYFLRAFDACGREAPGFPKFTGQWIIPSPTVADLDDDAAHSLEVTVSTRSGYLYAWHTSGHASGSVQWPTFRHDNANTGNYGTPLDFGTLSVAGTPAVSCPAPSVDAGMPMDASMMDARAPADAGTPPHAGGGCGCRATRSGRKGTACAMVIVGMALVRRKRRR